MSRRLRKTHTMSSPEWLLGVGAVTGIGLVDLDVVGEETSRLGGTPSTASSVADCEKVSKVTHIDLSVARYCHWKSDIAKKNGHLEALDRFVWRCRSVERFAEESSSFIHRDGFASACT